MAAARRAPDRLAGVLLAGSRPEPDTPERYAKRAETIAIARERGAEGIWEAMRATLFTDDSDEDVVAQARELALDRTEQELVSALEAIRDRPDSTEAYRALGDRAFTVVGDRDPFVPVEDARALRAGRGRDPRVRASAQPRAAGRVRPGPRRRGGAVDVDRDEVVRRLGEDGFVLLDVRSPGGVPRRDRRSVRSARRPDPRRPALRPPGPARADAGGDPRAARAARGRRARLLLPLRLALRARDGDPLLARLPRRELPRLLARVVAGRRRCQPRRARPRRERPSRGFGRARSSRRSARGSRRAARPRRRRRRDPPRATTRPARPAPRDGTGRPTPDRAGTPGGRHGCARARRRRPGGRACSGATGRRRTGDGSDSATGSAAPASVTSTWNQPTSGSADRKTRAPAARAISCEPRQTPSIGVPRSSCCSR